MHTPTRRRSARRPSASFSACSYARSQLEWYVRPSVPAAGSVAALLAAPPHTRRCAGSVPGSGEHCTVAATAERDAAALPGGPPADPTVPAPAVPAVPARAVPAVQVRAVPAVQVRAPGLRLRSGLGRRPRRPCCTGAVRAASRPPQTSAPPSPRSSSIYVAGRPLLPLRRAAALRDCKPHKSRLVTWGRPTKLPGGPVAPPERRSECRCGIDEASNMAPTARARARARWLPSSSSNTTPRKRAPLFVGTEAVRLNSMRARRPCSWWRCH